MKFIDERNKFFESMSNLQQLAWFLQENIFNQFNRDYLGAYFFKTYLQEFLTIDEILHLFKWIAVIYDYLKVASDLEEKAKGKK